MFAYVLRSILNASTSDEVISQLSRFPIYSGYSLNILSACKKSFTNIEGYGDRIAVQSKGTSQSSKPQYGVIGHFNAYLNSAVPQDTEGGTSNERRECQLASGFNGPADVRSFLGNLSCPVFFTDLNGVHNSETMGSWLIEPITGTCTMYRLPVDCEVKQSKCYSSSSTSDGGIVYDWTYKCNEVAF